MSDERPEPIDVVAEFIASEVGFHAEGMREQAQDLLAALTASGWAVAPADIVERHQRDLERRDVAVRALALLGSAWRGDWSDFDGRTLLAQLGDIAGMLTSDEPGTVEHFCSAYMICPTGGHWTDYCTDECRVAAAVDGAS